MRISFLKLFRRSYISIVLFLESDWTGGNWFFAFPPCTENCELQDSHILELSKRITNEEELLGIGINVLGLPDFKIKSAVYDHRKIQPASYEVLSTWAKQQVNRVEERTSLVASLERRKMFHLVSVLKPTVEQAATFAVLSQESKYNNTCGKGKSIIL